MARKQLIIALGMIAAASPALATHPKPVPETAPAGTPNTRYCLRVEVLTGSFLETVECRTREEWADDGVDVDKEWPREGVKVIG